MHTLLSFSLLFFVTTTWAQIPKEQCPSFDNSKNFGPVRNQDGHGYCWAFAAAALTEEKLCKENPSFCGKHLSVLDTSRCEWGLDKSTGKLAGLGTSSASDEDSKRYEGEGSYVINGLTCALGRGSCEENKMPYHFARQYIKAVLNCNNQACLTNHMRDYYLKHEIIQNKINHELLCYKNRTTFQRIMGFINVKWGDLSELVNKTILKNSIKNRFLTDEEVNEVLRVSGDEIEFLKNILTTKDCTENRIRPKKWNTPRTQYYKEFQNLDSKLKLVIDQLRNQKSSAAEMCSSYYFETVDSHKSSEEVIGEGNCGAHAVVIIGSQFKDGRCQLKIRNSWGVGARLHGWIDAKDFLDATYGLITY